MNKKILGAVAITVVIIVIGIVGIKALMGDESTELPYEEKVEKSLNLQESPESGESEEDEARENEP
jgi:hypothetical protein